MKTAIEIRADLSESGRKLLKLIVRHLNEKVFVVGNPETYLGYKDCCEYLEIEPSCGDVPWGRLLQQNGLNDLNDWTKRHNLPRISGLIVNKGGDRQHLPGGDFFKSNEKKETDFPWWESEVKASKLQNWGQYL